MLIYIINMISILFYALIYSMNRTKQGIKKILIVLLTIQLIGILALRHFTVGIDVPDYLDYFKNYIPNFTFEQFMDHRFEIGYKVVNKTISIITVNDQIFFLIMALMAILPVSRFIYKYSKMPFLSFGLYIAFNFYLFTFSGLRQAIAYGIILISYDFIIRKKLLKFIFIVLLASLFHKTALIFIPAYFIANIKLTKRNMLIYLIVIGVLYYFRKSLFEILIQTFYPRYEVVESSAINWMLLGFIIIFFGMFFYKKVVDMSPNSNSYYIFMVIGVSVMIFATVGTNVMRLADYYYVFVIVFIPEILNSIKEKGILIFGGYMLIIAIFILNLWFLIYSDTYKVVPYKFFWE